VRHLNAKELHRDLPGQGDRARIAARLFPNLSQVQAVLSRIELQPLGFRSILNASVEADIGWKAAWKRN
jgi:hypothetical protein